MPYRTPTGTSVPTLEDTAGTRVRVRRELFGAGISSLEEEDEIEEDEVEESAPLDTKSIMKKRHLNRDERRLLHKPAPDYIQTPHGEVLRSTSSLEVDDIISKHITTSKTTMA